MQKIKEYDVYYTTGGGTLVGGGADVWVNNWIKEIAPKLDVTPKLMIHRNRPNVEWSLEQHEKFEDKVKKNQYTGEGRSVHQQMKKNFKEATNQDVNHTWTTPKSYTPAPELEYFWQGDDMDEFEKIMKGARRIHILHGYYSPHRYISENLDKIHTNAVHCDVHKAIMAPVILGLEKSFHFHMEKQWENEIVESAKHPFWIGVSKPNLKKNPNHLLHIPNYYEFKHNKDVTDNNRIGFAARMESRKCPHFLDGLKADVYTDKKDIQWWERNLNLNTKLWRKFVFRWEHLDRFYQRDWGISHSAHIYEPFGYSIFQAVDWGKVPILAHDWLPEYDYKFRASNPTEFKEQYKKLCEVSLDGRRNILNPLREYLTEKFDNKEEWVEKMLKLYNE